MNKIRKQVQWSNVFPYLWLIVYFKNENSYFIPWF